MKETDFTFDIWFRLYKKNPYRKEEGPLLIQWLMFRHKLWQQSYLLQISSLPKSQVNENH